MIRVVRELAGAATSEAREAEGAATAQAGALGETSGPDNETGHPPGDRPGPS
jgi:hypothetical protein